jgi:hypothetical protein
MNNTQHEQLFTDLTPEQAENISAAAVTIASASYGTASATLDRSGPGSFKVRSLFVKDTAADGFPVYAKFQALATDGTILTTPSERFDRKGANGSGTTYRNLTGSFGKNISQVRLGIYLSKPGPDTVIRGNWKNL